MVRVKSVAWDFDTGMFHWVKPSRSRTFIICWYQNCLHYHSIHIVKTSFFTLDNPVMVLPHLSPRNRAATAEESVRRVRGAKQRPAEARRDSASRRQSTGSRNRAAATTQCSAPASPRQPARCAGQQFCPFAPSRWLNLFQNLFRFKNGPNLEILAVSISDSNRVAAKVRIQTTFAEPYYLSFPWHTILAFKRWCK